MKIKITSNLKSFEKNLNKVIQKKIEEKENEIKRKNFANMPFEPLDIESEKVLKELLNNKEFYNCPCFIVPNNYSPSVIENLIDLGYLHSKKGVEYFLGGEGFVCGARLTQKAKSYDEQKTKYLENSKLQGNISYNFNFSGADLSNSNNQIGNSETKQKIDKRNQTNIAQEKQKFNFWTMIVIPIFVAVVAGIIVWLITKS